MLFLLLYYENIGGKNMYQYEIKFSWKGAHYIEIVVSNNYTNAELIIKQRYPGAVIMSNLMKGPAR